MGGLCLVSLSSSSSSSASSSFNVMTQDLQLLQASAYPHLLKFGPAPVVINRRLRHMLLERPQSSEHCQAVLQCWPFAAREKALPSEKGFSERGACPDLCCFSQSDPSSGPEGRMDHGHVHATFWRSTMWWWWRWYSRKDWATRNVAGRFRSVSWTGSTQTSLDVPKWAPCRCLKS